MPINQTAIVNARIFDGYEVLPERIVVLEGSSISRIGGDVPPDAVVVDAGGGTLLPGLIDAHVHTNEEALALALKFGVTTELEMQGVNTRNDRAHISENDEVADVRSSGFAITPPKGHPSELFPKDFRPDRREPSTKRNDPLVRPFSQTPEEATAFIPQIIASGADYIKFMVDDGSIEGHPGLPMLDQATLNAGVAEAHRHGMMTIAHALTIETTRMCLEAGIDGLAHLFMDGPHTDEIVSMIAASWVFVVPCVVLNASMMGITGESLAEDPRVSSRLDEAWSATLKSSFNRYPQGRLDDVLGSLKALHDAKVDLLIGTDVSQPFAFLGGLAHGASVHQEMQYFVQAGLTPSDALQAATAIAAKRFGLSDRGKIEAGLRADLLLVDGDPTADITDTLNIRSVWRRGHRIDA